MKIFIWDGVLCGFIPDGGCGMAVAYAATLEEALNNFDEYIEKELRKEIPTKVIDCETDKENFSIYIMGNE